MSNQTNHQVGQQIFEEFVNVVALRSAYAGEVSYSYMAGFYESCIKYSAHLPEVQELMKLHINDYLKQKAAEVKAA